MPLDPETLKDLSPARVAYIEEQATKCHDFTLESRENLARNSTTTLQWYFGIIVGGCGYLVSMLRNERPEEPSLAWLGLPIAFAVLVAIAVVVWLMRKALLATHLYPRGNEPKNFVTPALAAEDDHWIRCCEVAALQRRIEENLGFNASAARVLNRARLILAGLPPATVFVALVCKAATLSWAHLP
jgi:MFS family permease